MVMTAMVMMAIAMVLVMVITVPEALGQVSWLCHYQHRTFHKLGAINFPNFPQTVNYLL
jgi:hypothetical protein